MKGLGERIRQRREALKLSQGDLAEAISAKRRKRQSSVNRVAISLFENDRRIPSAASLVELADVLQCSVDWLLGRIQEPEGTTKAPRKPAAARSGAEPEEGQELEQAQAQADREGRTTVLWRGKLYMRKKSGWESVQ